MQSKITIWVCAILVVGFFVGRKLVDESNTARVVINRGAVDGLQASPQNVRELHDALQMLEPDRISKSRHDFSDVGVPAFEHVTSTPWSDAQALFEQSGTAFYLIREQDRASYHWAMHTPENLQALLSKWAALGLEAVHDSGVDGWEGYTHTVFPEEVWQDTEIREAFRDVCELGILSFNVDQYMIREVAAKRSGGMGMNLSDEYAGVTALDEMPLAFWEDARTYTDDVANTLFLGEEGITTLSSDGVAARQHMKEHLRVATRKRFQTIAERFDAIHGSRMRELLTLSLEDSE